jgi:hypothetical protein
MLSKWYAGDSPMPVIMIVVKKTLKGTRICRVPCTTALTDKLLLSCKSCIKAVAWAKPSRGQAVFGSFGLAWDLRKPKPGLSGQAGPEQHYY